MFLSELVPAVIYGLLALTIPESPRYLIARGEMKKAKEVLTRYVGGNVEKTSTDILKTVEGKPDRPPFSILRGSKFGLLPIVWIGIGLSVLQQFTYDTDKGGGKVDLRLGPAVGVFGRYGRRDVNNAEQPPLPLPSGGAGNGMTGMSAMSYGCPF